MASTESSSQHRNVYVTNYNYFIGKILRKISFSKSKNLPLVNESPDGGIKGESIAEEPVYYETSPNITINSHFSPHNGATITAKEVNCDGVSGGKSASGGKAASGGKSSSKSSDASGSGDKLFDIELLMKNPKKFVEQLVKKLIEKAKKMIEEASQKFQKMLGPKVQELLNKIPIPKKALAAIIGLIGGIAALLGVLLTNPGTGASADLINGTNATNSSANSTLLRFYNENDILLFEPDDTNKKFCDKGYVGKNCEIKCGSPGLSIVFIYFTYSATIRINNMNHTISNSSVCSGTLLDKTTVLTSAECIVDKIHYKHPVTNRSTSYDVVPNSFNPTYESMYTVFLGEQKKPNNLNSGNGVSEIIKHENFNKLHGFNNIALLKLDNEAVLSDKVQVACLPPVGFNLDLTPELSSNTIGKDSNQLVNIQLTIWNREKCLNVDNWNSQLCAGDLTCHSNQVDSGSPLYIQDTAETIVVVGITSNNFNCQNYQYPVKYTRVSFYYEWIMNRMD